MDEPKSQNKTLVAILVIVVLVIAGAGIVALSARQSKTTTDSTTSSTTSSTTTSGSGTNNATATSGNYKDGTYTATGSYQTPGGSESIDVKVTLASNVITDVSVTQNSRGGESKEYQDMFVSGYKSQVQGKKINEVSLSRVAGSSLTPGGFNNALADIEKQAEA